MPDSWVAARDAYNYPVNLADFADKHKYPGFFEHSVDGGLASTREFQNRFKRNAPYHLEAWYEVVYWKLYSQGGRGVTQTKKIIQHIKDSGATAEHLHILCHTYMQSGELQDFKSFQCKIVKSAQVAVVATFPAFLSPDTFPMADSQITRWATQYHNLHTYALCGGPILSEPPDLSGNIKALRNDLVRHRDFVDSWIRWCRFTAGKLTELTGCVWSARDVEMAVFTAQTANPRMTLKPLCAENQ